MELLPDIRFQLLVLFFKFLVELQAVGLFLLSPELFEGFIFFAQLFLFLFAVFQHFFP